MSKDTKPKKYRAIVYKTESFYVDYPSSFDTEEEAREHISKYWDVQDILPDGQKPQWEFSHLEERD